jgi:hypothetical protein
LGKAVETKEITKLSERIIRLKELSIVTIDLYSEILKILCEKKKLVE